MMKAIGCLAWIAAFLVVVGLIAKFFFVELAVVSHNAMAPTILTGERVLIWKNGEPNLGAIAVCARPRVGGFTLGRVIATENMAVAADRNRLRINNKKLDINIKTSTSFRDVDTNAEVQRQLGHEFLNDNIEYMVFLDPERPVSISPTRVPSGHVYLMSDNRGYPSSDSRTFSTVDASTCIGNVFFRLTPAEGLVSELEHGYFEILK